MVARKFTSEIEELLDTINESIHYLELDAEQKGISVYSMKYPDGSFAIERLLLAKAHTLHMIVLINSQATMLVKNRSEFEKEAYGD